MKIKNITLLMLSFAFALTSCNEWLDVMPDNRAEVDTAEKVEKLLVSAYPNISQFILGELSSWPTEKFTLVYRLIEKINIGIEFELKDRCETCGGEITVPITFPDGYKSLFVPTVSDFGDELL